MIDRMVQLGEVAGIVDIQRIITQATFFTQQRNQVKQNNRRNIDEILHQKLRRPPQTYDCLCKTKNMYH